jgi:hypothetical protein
MPLENRATTDEKKREIIEKLYAAWVAHPEQRLCQLISNVTDRYFFDLQDFYVEDEPLGRALVDYAKT